LIENDLQWKTTRDVPRSTYPLFLFGVIRIQCSRTKAEGNGVGRFFSVWESLSSTELAEEKTEKGEEGFTVFTVSDDTWLENINQGPGTHHT